MCALTAFAQPQFGPKPSGKKGKVDAEFVEMGEFAKMAEQDLAQTILVSTGDASVKMNIPKGVKINDYGKFLSILNVNDYTAFRIDDMVRIIPLKDARSSSVPVVEPDGKYYEDEFVTEYIYLEKACASKMLPVLRPMIPQHSHMAANDSDSMLITDTYGNIQRIKNVINKMEKAMEKKQDCHFSN